MVTNYNHIFTPTTVQIIHNLSLAIPENLNFFGDKICSKPITHNSDYTFILLDNTPHTS